MTLARQFEDSFEDVDDGKTNVRVQIPPLLYGSSEWTSGYGNQQSSRTSRKGRGCCRHGHRDGKTTIEKPNGSCYRDRRLVKTQGRTRDETAGSGAKWYSVLKLGSLEGQETPGIYV
jgi:hypothetical protein